MNKKTKLYTFLLVSLLVPQSWASTDTEDVPVALQADDLVIVQAGEKVYQTQCASCHGVYLEGQPDWRTRDANGFLPAPPHDATGHTWHHADDLLFKITKFGPAVVIGDEKYKTMMPAYKAILSDEEIIAVLSFIKNTWPEEQRSWQDEVNGNQGNAFSSLKKKKPSLLDKLLK